MQIDCKVSVDKTEGYNRAVETLAGHHIRDEYYYDFFFDFGFRALQEQNTVLRLRVPCRAPDPGTVTAAGSPSPSAVHIQSENGAVALASDANTEGTSNAGVRGYDPDASFKEFIETCRVQSTSLDNNASAVHEQHSLQTGIRRALPASSTADLRYPSLPCPGFFPDATGKLFLKQKNTITDGDQVAFVKEDQAVPAHVVMALVDLAPSPLFISGIVPASDNVTGNMAVAKEEEGKGIADVLADYAKEHPYADDDSRSDSPIVLILNRLRDIACVCAPESTSPSSRFVAGRRVRSEVEERDARYTQVRFASMGACTTYTAEQRQGSGVATSAGSGASPPADLPALEIVGGFMTLRKVYHYTGVLQGANEGKPAGSPRHAEFRERLQVRLDASYLLPGVTSYELEVPNCGGLIEEVLSEVRTFLTHCAVAFRAGCESKYARYVRYLAAARGDEQYAADVKLRLTNAEGYEELRRKLHLFTNSPSPSSSSLPEGQSRFSPKRRRVSNTTVDDSADDDDGSNGMPEDVTVEENKDYFFDTPEQTLRNQHSLLRLRSQIHSKKYTLVLKEHQVFNQGQQNSLMSKAELPEGAALKLIENPTQFLQDNHDGFAVLKKIWDFHGLRELRCTAMFKTERLTVPWYSAQSQVSTLPRKCPRRSGGGANGASSALPGGEAQMQPTHTSASYIRSQLQRSRSSQQNSPVQALLIHLDKTLYIRPPDAKAKRAPFSNSQPWLNYQQTTYEIEVTNFDLQTEQKSVKLELSSILQGLGVEFASGVESKLEHYFSFLGELE